ncbi:MAG: hypothetical protein U1F10_04620 [Burkholderiales bacterium]
MDRNAAAANEPFHDDPPPRFPSADELDLADELRRRIEERYLGAATLPAAARKLRTG